MYGDGGKEFRIRAIGNGALQQSQVVPLAGPPIGFKVLFGESVGRTFMPLAMQTIITTCACDFSYYLGDQGPRDMNTDSVSGTPDT